MMMSLNENILRITGPLWAEFAGEFPSQRPVTRNFDVFFDLRLNKRLSKPSRVEYNICVHIFNMIQHVMLTLINLYHYNDVIMGTIASQITSVSSVYSTVSTGTDQRKHPSSASLAFVRGIHRGPVNSPHKWPVTRKLFPFHDVKRSV